MTFKITQVSRSLELVLFDRLRMISYNFSIVTIPLYRVSVQGPWRVSQGQSCEKSRYCTQYTTECMLQRFILCSVYIGSSFHFWYQ